MPRTRKTPTRTAGVHAASRTTAANGSVGDVLTLAEAAEYLRLPEGEVVRLTQTQDLPGRCTGSEWRFLKSALENWLATPGRQKRGVLAHVGAFKDDPDLEKIARQAEQHIQGGE